MIESNNILSKNRRISRSVFIASVAVLFSAASMIETLYYQCYLPTTLLVFSVFIFPISFVCGFISGLVSPKKAIVWAPLWACIASMLIMVSMSGTIHDTSITQSSWRIAWVLGGVLIAGVSALFTEWIVLHGYAVRLFGAFFIACVVLSYANFRIVTDEKAKFIKTTVSKIESELNSDFVSIPKDTKWYCIRRPKIDAYELSTRVHGAKFIILVNADDNSISAITYNYKGTLPAIGGTALAKSYLKKFGFRDKLLISLTKNSEQANSWVASIDNIKLTLYSRGGLSVRSLPLGNTDDISRDSDD